MKEYVKDIDIERINQVIIGTGQYGKLYLLQETKDYLDEKNIGYSELPTPELVDKSENIDTKEGKMYIIHVTC